MLDIHFHTYQCPPDHKTVGGRLIPVLGAVREQGAPGAKTPKVKCFPILGETIMAFTLTDSQQVDVAVKIVDKKGNPAKLDGVPDWQTDNSEVLALTPSADGLTCTVVAVGPLGTARVSMTADADLGAGVTPIAGVLDVEVTAGAATTVTLTPGAPAEQP